jgi:hypothetical protein
MKYLIFAILLLFGCENKSLIKDSQDGRFVEFENAKCNECKMDIHSKEHTTQLIDKSGKAHFFDDVGCMVLWIEKQKPTISSLWVFTKDTKRYIKIDNAKFLPNEKSPMGYNFGIYENSKDGISYDEMRLKIIRGN